MALVSFPGLVERGRAAMAGHFHSLPFSPPPPECTPAAPGDEPSDCDSVSSLDGFVLPPRAVCRFRLTAHGCEVPSLPTTKLDCPCTVRKGATTLFRYPHRFQALIMQKDVNLDMFRRDQLNDIMLQCFESPFESPSRAAESRTAVRVEFSIVEPNESTTRLRKLSDRQRDRASQNSRPGSRPDSPPESRPSRTSRTSRTSHTSPTSHTARASRTTPQPLSST